MNSLKCPSVFKCSCCRWVSEFQAMVHVPALVAPDVLRPGAAGSEVSSAPAGHLVPTQGWGSPENGECLQAHQQPDSSPKSSTRRDGFNLKAGICAFSAVLGGN